jgi:uncharacterized membrane protein YhhN
LHLIIVILALPLLIGLLFFTKKESVRGTLFTKLPLSVLFVIIAFMASSTNLTYYNILLAGMLFCLAGDVLLIFPTKKFFLAGLLSFMAGHVLYTLAFFLMARTGLLTWVVAAFCLTAGGMVFFLLNKHLGKMRIPVIAYIMVITVMVIGAASFASNGQIGLTGRVLVFCGALLFYFSDFLVARQRFVKKQYINRLAGLPMYYAGQFMIACSLHFI